MCGRCVAHTCMWQRRWEGAAGRALGKGLLDGLTLGWDHLFDLSLCGGGGGLCGDGDGDGEGAAIAEMTASADADIGGVLAEEAAPRRCSLTTSTG